jgi:hypothetical protein
LVRVLEESMGVYGLLFANSKLFRIDFLSFPLANTVLQMKTPFVGWNGNSISSFFDYCFSNIDLLVAHCVGTAAG